MVDTKDGAPDAGDNLQSGFRLDDWLIEPLTSTFKRNGHTSHVEPRVMDVLLCLARNAGAVVTRDQLLHQVWAHLVVSDEVLTRCISELRAALGDTSRERRFIRTVPKRGYSLLMPVKPLAAEGTQVKEKPAGDSTVAEPNPFVHQELQEPLLALEPGTVEPLSRPVSAASATPWLVREIINFFQWIIRLIARAGAISVALLAGIVVIGVLVVTLGDPEISITQDSAVAANAEEAPGDLVRFKSVSKSAGTDNTGVNTAPASDVMDNEPLTAAVLPFINLSGDADSDYFSNGLTEDIRNILISTPGLGIRVAARTSSEVFRNRALDIREIGQQLNTKNLVEGTVRISGDRVRVTVQVTNADDGFPSWAESFERPLDDPVRLQTEIAEKIVRQLAPTLASNAVAARPEQVGVKAYDYYWLGRHHWDQRNAASLEKAAEYFRAALRQDDKFALAYSGLADALVLTAIYGAADQTAANTQATELVKKALQLNPELAEAYASQGLILHNRGEDSAARKAFERSIALNPDYSMARMWLAGLLMEQNDLNAAFEQISVALQVDPLHPTVQQNYLDSLYAMGRYAEATKLADKFYAQSKSELFLKMRLYALLNTGRYDEVLKFAVRHNFSDEYAMYASRAVVEALIYLQRYAEADDMINRNAQHFTAALRVTFAARQAIAKRDAARLIEAAQQMAAIPEEENQHIDCKTNEINHWRGLAAGFNKDFSRATGFFKASLTQEAENCANDVIRRATFYAYYAQSLRRTGQDKLAGNALQEAWRELEYAIEHGRRGADVVMGKAELLVAAGKNAEASEQIDVLLKNKWQFYGQLKYQPLFDEVDAELAERNGDISSQYESMQENCQDLRLTKFGV